MSIFHYDHTPLPVGARCRMNGSDTSFMLGIFDGANYGDQVASDPEEGVLFQSPEGAKRWLDAAQRALASYIESGDTSNVVPEADGWGEE